MHFQHHSTTNKPVKMSGGISAACGWKARFARDVLYCHRVNGGVSLAANAIVCRRVVDVDRRRNARIAIGGELQNASETLRCGSVRGDLGRTGYDMFAHDWFGVVVLLHRRRT